jgi:Demethylmenaquinone methyltransferase
MKVAGPAFTVHGVVTPSCDKTQEQELMNLGMIRSMTRGCVQVRGTQDSTDCSHIGDVNTLAAKAAGCNGIVVDGATRDSNAIINMGYPLFCRFRTPAEGIGRFFNIDYQVPLLLRSIDGYLQVNPGDYVFGDNDGVVIVPRDLTIPVLEKAEKLNEMEEISRERIANGEDPIRVYLEVGQF